MQNDPADQAMWYLRVSRPALGGRSDDDDGETSWDSVASKEEMFNEVVKWHHEQVAYLLDRLKQVKDGSGSLLDHSMLLYGSSLGNGSDHTPEDIPTLVAGRGGGAIETGRIISNSQVTSMSRIYLSMLNGLGIPLKRFGETESPLDQLRV